MTTIYEATQIAKKRIVASSSPALDAHMLLCAALGVERAYLLAHPEQPLTAEQWARFDALVARRQAGEPIAYIIGRRAFYDRDFIVTPDVLVPRPETEHLLEEALDYAQGRGALVAVDVGTGSGALAVCFAAHRPAARVIATDISAASLAVARQNAAQYQIQLEFLEGDLLEPLIARGIKADLIMANLPYIHPDALPELDVSLYEPRIALDGGGDGLALVRRLLTQTPAVLLAGGLLLLEIGADQGVAALAAVRERLPTADVRLLKDYAGHDRVVRVQL